MPPVSPRNTPPTSEAISGAPRIADGARSHPPGTGRSYFAPVPVAATSPFTLLRSSVQERLPPCRCRSRAGTSIPCACAPASSRASPASAAPDVICLQETKCPDAVFPKKPFEARLPSHRHRRPEGLPRRGGALPPADSPVASRAPSAARATPATSPSTLRRGRAPACASTISTSPPAATSQIPRSTEVRPQARVPGRDERVARRSAGRDGPRPGDPRRRPQHRAAARTTSGRTSSFCASSATRRSRPSASKRVRAAGGWVDAVPRATAARRRSTPGGATARGTGRRPTAVAGSTIYGCRHRFAGRALTESKSCATRAAGNAPPTMCR